MAVPPRIHLSILTKDQLVDRALGANRAKVRLLLADPKVHILVLLESHLGDCQFSGIGPTLKYTSVLSLMAADFSSFTPKAYYEKTDEDCGRVPTATSESESLRIRDLEAELSDLKKRYQSLQQEHEVAKLQVGQSREASHLQAASFTRRDEDLNHGEGLLAEREQALAEMEESLISRLNEHMEKLAELEQREEDLFARERRLQASGESAESTG
ncbi:MULTISPECIES: hypothetical protein [unclassified Lentimonas]|uniref:hypothetical protein n=1 Tax=unclassified Lentimonas TaxID=2630993 RepID=UPI001326177C|nr:MULTISPECIES: hypothetical protein [unclassified Lentimonas]CAA6690432.1 Unannotated [Lentimonas sp. CC19]CAA6693858.1 Unannotated [Lentimonas sp. CC10]CAA7068636.1 Unannotated [Lentimonas sp. CC11]